MIKKSRGAPIGNQNAKVDNPKTSLLALKCLTSDKNNWVRAAYPLTLQAWVITTLNTKARNEHEEPK